MDPSEVSSAVGALEIKGRADHSGQYVALIVAAHISVYEFLPGLIKTVAGKDQSDLTSFSADQQAAINANFHKRGKSEGLFRVHEIEDTYVHAPRKGGDCSVIGEEGQCFCQ